MTLYFQVEILKPKYNENVKSATKTALKSERKKKVSSLKNKCHQGLKKVQGAKERYYEDPEVRRQYRKRKYQENPEQQKDYEKEKYKENPEQKREYEKTNMRKILSQKENIRKK